ncbi:MULTISPECIES: ABC transporter ATP-binding protein [unclassified Acidisoma]|jgi:multiple sugar transport system ATP-binding protein|uniref:ABC transporter ATP-binding protein n=1 Tax=unclassified Acidisoma TaxID=2634065 RepID=UPI00131D92AA|nr:MULTISPECIES: ABC transporter ATP-binding protein [unclassified Acidisoma]
MADVQFEHVYKLFGDHPVVNDLSLDIADGEFLVLLGPSGCGKTTSLRMLAGLERPTYGRIAIGQRTVNALPSKARDVAMVFQNYALYPHKTVRGNLAFGMKLRRVPKAEMNRQLDEVATLLGLKRLLDSRPAELSGGERQRVALGRALLRRPKVFLMDEPLSNLDATLRAQMRAELIRLHTKLNATIVYVTHDQAEAMTMATRIAVMSKGHLAQVGTPQQIYDSPADLFVATFVGLPKMNVVTGRLGSVDNSPVLEVLGRTIRMDPASFVSPNSSSSAEVFVGIRPEDVLCDPGNPQDAIYGDVEVVEPLGSETLVTARCDETTTLVARVPPRTPIAIGDRIRIQINTQHLHLFDKTTQQSLLLPTTSGPVKTWQPEVFAEVRAN